MVVKFLNSRPMAEQETALAKMLKLSLREVGNRCGNRVPVRVNGSKALVRCAIVNRLRSCPLDKPIFFCQFSPTS